MLTTYFGETNTFHKRRLLGIKYKLLLFTGMWGFAQHGMQQAGLVPAVKGFDYLDFANYLFQNELPDLQARFHQMSKS